MIARLLLLVLLALPAFQACASEIGRHSPNALVCLAVASLREEPAHSSELSTQALMGTPVAVGERDGDWYKALLPDGYEAYIHRTAFVAVDSAAMCRWREAERLIGVSPFETHSFAGPSDKCPTVSDFVMGCIVEGRKSAADDGFTAVRLPDGRCGWVRSDAVEPFGEWMKRRFDAERVISLAKALTGSAYLWGGRSTKGVDCSGLTQLCFFDSGIMLPRNASQQALDGVAVSEPHAAALLFFDNDNGRITHVAVFDRQTLYIHSSGMVHMSSFDPRHPLYNGRKVHSLRRT